MRIAMPFANQYAAMGGFLQGGNQAQERAQKFAQAAAAQRLAERSQAHREKTDEEQIGFEKFKYGADVGRQKDLDAFRDALLGKREGAARQFQGGESALQRAMTERLAGRGEAGADRRQGAELSMREKLQLLGQGFASTENALGRGHEGSMEELRQGGARKLSRQGFEQTRDLADDERGFELPFRNEELDLRKRAVSEAEAAGGHGRGMSDKRFRLDRDAAVNDELHRRAQQKLAIEAMGQKHGFDMMGAIDELSARLDPNGKDPEGARLEAERRILEQIDEATQGIGERAGVRKPRAPKPPPPTKPREKGTTERLVEMIRNAMGDAQAQAARFRANAGRVGRVVNPMTGGPAGEAARQLARMIAGGQ